MVFVYLNSFKNGFGTHLIERSSTYDIIVAFVGMTGGIPNSPYAISGGHIILRFEPFFIPTIPISQARMAFESLWPRINFLPSPHDQQQFHLPDDFRNI